jgi:hypothetical protein
VQTSSTLNTLEQNSYLLGNVCLAIPLVSALPLVPKETFRAEHSRLISRVRPKSLLAMELGNLAHLKTDVWPSIHTGDHIFFPTEQVRSIITSHGKWLLWVYLEFEDSLQAPAVRQALARIRKAASRVIQPQWTEEWKKGARRPVNILDEKIILLPIAETVPKHTHLAFDCLNVAMTSQGLYCCGDSFWSSSSEEPWQEVIRSVQAVTSVLA